MTTELPPPEVVAAGMSEKFEKGYTYRLYNERQYKSGIHIVREFDPTIIDGILCRHDTEEEAVATRDRVLMCLTTHDELVEALRELRDYYTATTGLPACKANAVLAKVDGR